MARPRVCRRTPPPRTTATATGRWSSSGSTPIRPNAERMIDWTRAYWQALHPHFGRRRLHQHDDGGGPGPHARRLTATTTTGWPGSRPDTTRTTCSGSTRTSSPPATCSRRRVLRGRTLAGLSGTEVLRYAAFTTTRPGQPGRRRARRRRSRRRGDAPVAAEVGYSETAFLVPPAATADVRRPLLQPAGRGAVLRARHDRDRGRARRAARRRATLVLRHPGRRRSRSTTGRARTACTAATLTSVAAARPRRSTPADLAEAAGRPRAGPPPSSTRRCRRGWRTPGARHLGPRRGHPRAGSPTSTTTSTALGALMAARDWTTVAAGVAGGADGVPRPQPVPARRRGRGPGHRRRGRGVRRLPARARAGRRPGHAHRAPGRRPRPAEPADRRRARPHLGRRCRRQRHRGGPLPQQ